VWLTWVLYLVIVAAMIIILPVASTLSVYQLWSNTTIAVCQTFIGITAAIFTAILSINVFKDTNEEGTELIVISKPITKWKLVFSKFAIFFTFCLMVNLTAVLLTVFTIFIPNIERKFYWGLVLSMFIGNLVTFGIFGAISILLSIRFAKVGIIVTNVIITIVLLAYQILTVFVFNNSLMMLAGQSDSSINIQSFILPVRNTETGEYTEDNFVDFVSGLNKSNEYDMKVLDWAGVKDYWEGKNGQNKKENWKAIVATDIGTQLSLSYLTVGVNGYSDRQAQRMYNFSRYYDYELTQPASPEYFDAETGKPTSPLKMVYTNSYNWSYIEVSGKIYYIYLPLYYVIPGVRSTKASFLKGTVTDVIPVADLKGKKMLAHTDVTFEPSEWQAYKPFFDIMYDNIFKWDIKIDSGDYYYDYSADKGGTLDTLTKNFMLNRVWCNSTENLKRYYSLVWACLSGNHGESQYFGANTPFAAIGCAGKDETRAKLNINSVADLNARFLQFKDYTFYKTYEEQQDLMYNGVKDDTEKTNEKPYYDGAKTLIDQMIEGQGLEQVGGYILRSPKDAAPQIPVIQPGTQTFNNTLLEYAKSAQIQAWKAAGAAITDEVWQHAASKGSYATWIKTCYIANYCSSTNEQYLFIDLDKPNRGDDWSSEQYLTQKNWYPYLYNWRYYQSGASLPFGQNLELSFYKATNRVQFWWFAVIWGTIALFGYAAGVVLYNKYDVK